MPAPADWPPLPAGALPLASDELRLVWCPQAAAPPRARRGRVDRVLRAALAPAVGVAPDGLRFGREEKGRPFLLSPDPPDFNLSDTEGGTLVALCRRGRIGVDLERTDREPAVLRLAERYFAAEETAALAAMPAEAARLAFLRLWTAKEASCKATGTGIFGWLPQWRFEAGAEQPRLQAAPDDAGALARWSHRRIAPAPTHTAVIALRDGGEPRLGVYQLAID